MITQLSRQKSISNFFRTICVIMIISVLLSVPGLGLVNVKAASPQGANALVLVNSASASYADFQDFIQPYLDNYGIPYTTLNIATTQIPADLSNYAVIIVGHRQLDPANVFLNSAEQISIAAAVNSGVGLVNFDNDLVNISLTPYYSFVQSIFNFTYPSTGVDSVKVKFPNPASHYITENHAAAETIDMKSGSHMVLADLTLPAGVTSIVDSETSASVSHPFLAVTTYGSGNAVQWASYDWMSSTVKGPLFGFDDLLWRSIVWAARKPFVLQGLPPFVTMRVDDVSGPLWWAADANQYGFIPWMGIFTDNFNAAKISELKTLVNGNKATAAIHAFNDTNFFYYNHIGVGIGDNFDDATMAANYTAATNWFENNQIPISKYVVPHFYEIGSNAFTGLANWNVEFIGTQMEPGNSETGSPWMNKGPFRQYQNGLANSSEDNPYYADYMDVTVPGNPSKKFFNCVSEVRDVTGYEWLGNGRNDLNTGIRDGTEWLKRTLNGMELATLFSHEYQFIDKMTEPDWKSMMQGITQNIAGYDPIYVSTDYACQYLRSMRDSNIDSSLFDPSTRQLSVTLSGNTDMATKFYVFNEQGGQITSQMVDVPNAINGTTTISTILPGLLTTIVVSPNPGTAFPAENLQFTAVGYSGETPIPNLKFTWSVVNGGGTIDSKSGLFTAGVAPGSYLNTIKATTSGISGFASVTVPTTYMHHFGFDTISSPQILNGPFEITIRALNENGFPVTSYSGAVSLSASTGTVSPLNVTLNGGVWKGKVTLNQLVTGVTLSVTDSTFTGISNAFDVAELSCPCNIWNNSAAPEYPNENDGLSIEIGTRFYSDTDGYINGIRFYKSAMDTGTHTVQLYSAAGDLLASTISVDETASGWQVAYFPTGIHITAGTTYVAAYFSPTGYYGYTQGYFDAGLDSPPLHVPGGGENGVFIFTNNPAYPKEKFLNSSYWVDVEFDTQLYIDTTPPTVVSVVPADQATNVSISPYVAAKFSEGIDPATLSVDTFILTEKVSGTPIPSTVSYNVTSRIATLHPDSPLSLNTIYVAKVLGGVNGIADRSGNHLVADKTWEFTTTGPLPDEGPGGPILVVSSAENPFSRYYTEILRAEGMNEFKAMDISKLTGISALDGYDVVILGEMSLTASQVTMFNDWVQAGGNLIAMRPDKQLLGLLGLTDQSLVRANAYLMINTATAPGTGLVNQTIQYHGTADLYALNGASALATIYSNAITGTTNPAVTLNNVGINGGKAAAFTYDLARSVVYTRQGNPAWAGDERDTQYDSMALKRTDDMFFGAKAGDEQPDWIDLNKVAIPQADEQQRLLANLILSMNQNNKPLPRFWYLPRSEKAVVIMTGDDHANGGTAGRFDLYKSASPANCSVINWECIRSTSYIYPETNLTPEDAIRYSQEGFEIAVHINTGPSNWTPETLESTFTAQLSDFQTKYIGLPAPVTDRNHFISWADWDTQAHVELAHGIRLDTNYYFWPPQWVGDRPGMFTGSGMPMRFADLDGTIVDVYQAATQMTDESGQAYPSTIVALLDKATGPEGYYGVFTVNTHTDTVSSPVSDAIIAAAINRQVPVISAAQMLTWLDGRNSSSFQSINWDNNTLSFNVIAGAGANGLQAMVPFESGFGPLVRIRKDLIDVSYSTQTIKGVEYAVFNATNGAYLVDYGVDTFPPVISTVNAAPDNNGTAVITWATNEPSYSRVDFGILPDSLSRNVTNPAMVTSHSITLTGLATDTTYYYRVTSADETGNSATSPVAENPAASFTTPGPTITDTGSSDFNLGTTGSCRIDPFIGNGSVRLPMNVDEDFPGSALPTGWSIRIPEWTPGGTVSVSGGQLIVDGQRASYDTAVGPGHSLEFVATFTASHYQTIGFGGGSDILSVEPIAMFGTRSTTNTIFTGIYLNNVFREVAIPESNNLIGTPHKYRIDWKTDGFDFYVDGTLVNSRTDVIGDQMKVAVSDFDTGGPSVQVDWIGISPYTAPCTFTSRIMDAGSSVNWGSISWNSNVPAGTSLAMSYRSGDTPDLYGIGWTPITGAAPFSIGGTSRFIQYQATFDNTGDANKSPALNDVTISYHSNSGPMPPVIVARAPAAGATNVPGNTSVTATFSEQMNEATINSSTFSLRAAGAGSDVPATVSYNNSTVTATLSLNSGVTLDPGVVYTLTIKGGVGGVANLFDIPLASDVAWSFTTMAPPGTFSKSSPSNSATEVAIIPTLSWGSSSGATGYQYCVDTSPSCSGQWIDASGTSAGLSGLTRGTTYYWQVQAINAVGQTVADGGWWSFTTTNLVTLVDGTTADFRAGQAGTCRIDAYSGNGTVQLPMSPEEGFSGPALPAGWTVMAPPWQTGGTATIVDGKLAVQGTRVNYNTALNPGQSLEFEATFKGKMSQIIGFGGGAFIYGNEPMASFGTNGTTNTLYTRIWIGGTLYDHAIPNSASYLGTPHLYRIDWKPTGFDFYIDHVLIESRTETISAPMWAAISDYYNAEPALEVDWVGLSPYASDCTFTSRVIDAGQPVTWESLGWTGTVPAGAGINFSYRSGETADLSSMLWTALGGSSPATLNRRGRYIQYRAALSLGTDPNQTPVLNDVTLSYRPGTDTTIPVILGRSPLADAVDVPLNSSVKAMFSEQMDGGMITASTFSLKEHVSGTPVAASVSYDPATFTATLAPGANLTGGIVYDVVVTVGAKDAAGNALAAEVNWSFTTFLPPPPPGPFSRIAPVDLATGVATNPTLSWNASTGAAGYQYCLETSQAACKWIDASGTSAALSGLAYGTTYYWQVQAVNQSGQTPADGGWWSFSTTPPPPPGAFGRIAPLNGTTEVATNPTLSWSASQGATGYRYCLETQQTTCTWIVTGATSVPLSSLPHGTTYYWQVQAVNDYGQTPADGTSWWSFTTTTLVTLVDSTAADFKAGQAGTCRIDAYNGDGAVQLPMAVEEGFTGPVIPAGWTVMDPPWQEDGTAAILDGQLAVQGARVNYNTALNPGQSLEFEATFKGKISQIIGFGGGASIYNNPPMASFGTDGTTDTLFTRIWTDGGIVNHPIANSASYLGTPHLYRIDWKPTGFDFYIDHVLIESRTETISEPMWAAISDYYNTEPALQVDWMGLTPYASGCTFTSRVFDAGQSVTWETLGWTGTVPAGAGINFSYRSGETADLSSMLWTALGGSSPATLNRRGRYIQYRAALSLGTDPNQTPVLKDVSLGYRPGNDLTAPVLLARSPLPDATNVPVSSVVTARFSEQMNASTISTSTFSLKEHASGTSVSAVVIYDALTFTATLTPGTSLSAGVMYDVVVTTGVKDAAGNGLAAEENWSFTTTPPPLPGAFGRIAPSNGATGVATNPTLSWNASQYASGYRYCLETSQDTCNWTIASGSSVSLSSLAYATTYYWQVKAMNITGETLADGGWWSFTTAQPPPPGAFSRSAPLNGAVDVATNPTLSWNTSLGATGYKYCLNTAASCSGPWTDSTGTEAQITGLTFDTVYYWHVQAINGTGETFANGDWWSFRTTTNPTGIDLATFIGSSAAYPNTAKLDWVTSSEVALEGFNLYRSESTGGPRIMVNGSLILAKKPGQMQGAQYNFTDAVEQGKHYFYWLEMVGFNGSHEYGPVAITARFFISVPVILK